MPRPKRYKDEPRIEWDNQHSTGFGGFRVVENLDKFIPPADWEVDPDDPSHFLPKYPPCRYRRLSQGTGGGDGRPWVKIHCLLFEEVVDMDTCMDCTDVQPPQEYIQLDMDKIEGADNPEEAAIALFKKQQAEREDRYEDLDMGEVVRVGEQIDLDMFVNPPDADPVFSPTQPSSEYVKKPGDDWDDVGKDRKEARRRKRKPTPWEPCVYREQVPHEECGTCVKFRCTCEDCPLIGRVLSKRDCRECPHRKES